MFTPEEGAAFNALADHVRLRRFGADCYAYGMLAVGCVALVVEASMNTWDFAAFIPIVCCSAPRFDTSQSRNINGFACRSASNP